MAKKNKDKGNKKDQTKSFCNLLKDNKSDISVLKNEEAISLPKLTQESVEKASGVPFDGVIPVAATEMIKDKVTSFEVNANYTNAIWKLFEMATSVPVRQTMIITLNSEDIPYAFESGFNSTITDLLSRTNLSLILNDLNRPMKKLKKWCDTDPENDMDMFVLHIPEMVLFTNKIRKEKASEGLFFNLLIQVIKTKKSVNKLRKKGQIETLSKFLIKCSLENVKNFGATSVIYELSDKFSEDYQEVAENWRIMLDADSDFTKLVNRLSFTVVNGSGFAIVSNEIWNGYIKGRADSKK